MTPAQLLARYRFLRRAGWSKTHARTAVHIFAGKYLGHFAKPQE